MTTPGGSPARTAWTVIGIVLGSILAIAGLVVLGLMILVIVGFNNWGSNK